MDNKLYFLLDLSVKNSFRTLAKMKQASKLHFFLLNAHNQFMLFNTKCTKIMTQQFNTSRLSLRKSNMTLSLKTSHI